MLLTDNYQTQISKRLQPIVQELINEDKLFQEKLNEAQQVQNLTNIFAENLTPDVFNNIADADLKQRCYRMLISDAVSAVFSELTPREIAIFDEAIKRK